MKSFFQLLSTLAVRVSPCGRQEALRLVRSGRIEKLRQLADAGDPQGRRQLAFWLARTDRISELRERTAGGDRYARRQLADWLVRQGRFDEAIDEMRPLAETGDTGAGRRLARLLAARGRVEEAMSVVERLPAGRVHTRQVCAWLASQGRVDLLRRLAAAGEADAKRELAWRVRNLWRAARLTPAVDLLTSVDLDDEYLVESLVRIANDWRYGRLGVRDEAIDLLGTVDHPLCRRARAGVLLSQGRRDEAITELRSLAANGDQAAGRDLTELLRRVRPARELRFLDHAEGGYLCAVAFSPDGSMLATCGYGDTILVWHPLTGEHLHTLRSLGAVGAIAFSPDSTLLAGNGGARGGAQLWNATTGAHLRHLGAHGGVEGVAFRADGTVVAVGALWTAAGERVLDLDYGEPSAVVVSPDNQLLATASRYSGSGQARTWNPAVRLWNLTTGEHVRDVVTAAGASPSPMSFWSLAFSPDGQLLAVACDKWVRLFDPTTGEQVRHICGTADAVAFHPDGTLLATARGGHWTDAGVRLWNPATGSLVRDLDTTANALAFSPDGAYLATASKADGVVQLWNITSPADRTGHHTRPQRSSCGTGTVIMGDPAD